MKGSRQVPCFDIELKPRLVLPSPPLSDIYPGSHLVVIPVNLDLNLLDNGFKIRILTLVVEKFSNLMIVQCKGASVMLTVESQGSDL